MRTVLVICAGLALAGCAHKGPMVAVTGGPLAPAKSFAITQDRPALGVEPQIAAALQGAGLKPAAADQTPDYLIQIGYADRPAKMGAYVPGATPAAAPALWLQTAPKSGPTSFLKKGSQALRVAVIETATGQDVRRVDASRFYWKAKPGDVAGLGAAAATALTRP